jgi:predicted dehydrogenase
MVVKSWNELSVLIAGCGSIGKRHARVLNGLGITDIRACDPEAGQRESLLKEIAGVRMYGSYEEALAGLPDTVLIATPPKLHVPMAMQAVRAGCHVLCEKPLSDSLKGIDELEHFADRNHKKVMVALCFRYHEAHCRAKRLLDEGRAGRLVSFRALMGEHLPDVRPDYRTLFTSKYSGAFDLMHEVDLAFWYAGRPMRSIACFSGTYSDIGIEAPDLVEMLIDFEDRVAAAIHLDLFQRPRRRVTELICTGGVITVEFARWDRSVLSVYDAAGGEWEQSELATDRDDMFRAEDREFLEAVAQNAPIHCTITEARKSLEAVVAAQEGHKPGMVSRTIPANPAALPSRLAE